MGVRQTVKNAPTISDAITCTPCPAGTYADADALPTLTGTCQPCAAGTYSPAAGLSACLNCPAGSDPGTTCPLIFFDCEHCQF